MFMPLNPIFEDRDLLVLDKPSGISVLADRTGAPCLWDEIRRRYAEDRRRRRPEAEPRPRLVHRLDKGTSGVFLVALSRACQRHLARAFAARQVRKHYLAVVAGHVPAGRSLTVSLPLRPGRKSRFRVAGQRDQIRASPSGWRLRPKAPGIADPGVGGSGNGRRAWDACTRLRALAVSPKRSLLAVQPLTGRSHQIRVHLAWIGHAVAGDHLYGAPQSAEQAAPRLALHAHCLVVPGHGVFRAPPTGLAALLN